MWGSCILGRGSETRQMYMNQHPVLDSPGKGQRGHSTQGLKVTRRLVIVSCVLSFMMAASLLVMIAMYFQRMVYLKDIDHQVKKLVNAFTRENPKTSSELDPVGFQIMRSLASIETILQALQAREEHARLTCEYPRHICTCTNKPTDGWTLNGSYLYYFSTDTKTWLDAKLFCIVNNSHLVSITSKEEQMYLTSMKGTLKYWIGLTNEKPGGSWYFVDGSDYKEPLFWAPTQPDNWRSPEGETEHCAEIYSEGIWNDILCNLQKRWICKKRCMIK